MGVVEVVLVTGLTVLCAFALERLLPRHDPREPPKRTIGLPLIGNLICMVRNGNKYPAIIGGNNPPPAFTIDLLFTKAYIVTSTKLMQAVQRNSKLLSFDPLLEATSSRMAGIRGHNLNVLLKDRNGGDTLVGTMHHATRSTLLGPGLDAMNRLMINYLTTSINELSNHNEAFDLYMWCRHAIFVASMDATYGPQNPFGDPEIEQAFWDWEMNSAYLLPDIYQSITARKPYYAREKVVRAMRKYLENDGDKTASELIQVRTKVMVEGGLDIEGISRAQAGIAFGVVTSTVPATFFMLFEVYSRPQLLAELREELKTYALTIENKNGTPRHIVDLAAIRTSCHHFVSTFQEMLRLHVSAATTRIVRKDVLVDDQYLFKKGNMVQMPALYFNQSGQLWGNDAPEFDSRRFLTNDGASGRSKGFISFGISPSICPGRHFAAGEIASLVAMLILRYNIKPVTESWAVQQVNTAAITSPIFRPKEPFLVTISGREEFKDAEWAFHVTEGKGKFNLIIG